MTDRAEIVKHLADEAASLSDRMHADQRRLFEILAVELSDDELRELSDEWFVGADEISVPDDDMSAYTTLLEWVASEMSGGDGGEHWLAPPRRPLRIGDVLA